MLQNKCNFMEVLEEVGTIKGIEIGGKRGGMKSESKLYWISG